MKYYIDTEFIEYPNTIDLISLGIKCEDGRTFYAESNQFDVTKASGWVKENVINQLTFHANNKKPFIDRNSSNSFVMFSNNKRIADVVKMFIGDDKPEFWGYYADYDWVVFCWLFGSMIDLPTGWPMYCKDLKQLLDESGKEKIPEPIGVHSALADAIWNEKLHKHLLIT
jgi:hypothetical protein